MCVEALDPELECDPDQAACCKPNPQCANVTTWNASNPQRCQSREDGRFGSCDPNGYASVVHAARARSQRL